MLHLIPAPLHRLALRVGHRLRKRWYRVTGRSATGVSVIGIDDAGRILLVRHGYGSGRWALPGGGVGRNEDPHACARREMGEELGCELDDLKLVGQFDDLFYGAPHHNLVFTCRFVGDPAADGREIVEVGWFARDGLPPDVVRFVFDRLAHAFPRG